MHSGNTDVKIKIFTESERKQNLKNALAVLYQRQNISQTVPERRRFMENRKRIVTIGRQYGSGGSEVGKKLAEKLGVHCYDKNILRITFSVFSLR